MPIYEYRCNACGHEFEEWQKMSDAPVRVCPKCKARKVEKLISHSSFQLKGSGWYVTDYGRRGTGVGGKKHSPDDGGGAKAAKDDGAKAAKDDGAKGDGKKATKDDGAKATKDDGAKAATSTAGGGGGGEKSAGAAASTRNSVDARAA